LRDLEFYHGTTILFLRLVDPLDSGLQLRAFVSPLVFLLRFNGSGDGQAMEIYSITRTIRHSIDDRIQG